MRGVNCRVIIFINSNVRKEVWSMAKEENKKNVKPAETKTKKEVSEKELEKVVGGARRWFGR